MRTEFGAPWCLALKVVSWGVTAGLFTLVIVTKPFTQMIPLEFLLGVVMPLSIPAIAIWFMTRGYALSDHTLEIKRLGWASRIDLGELVSAEADPDGMKGSIRTWGNGGLFAIAGYMYSKKLGKYRAWVTDPKKAVVLKFKDWTAVVSPDDPERFVEELRGELKSEK